ncbi:hypothetical protein ACFVHW_07045 [Streptomyces sp. NPDC127110]|uniref:hypothetical protein n=1 Tax=Streptomyces sp. NPDC127110 TaxID=3345362 RepID=UPI00364139AF
MTEARITQIIPPGRPLPARPPEQPRTPLPADWWQTPPPPLVPRPPVPPPHIPAPGPVDVHVTLSWAAPEPEQPPWWRRIRWGYNAGCLLCAGPVSTPWAWALDSARDSQGLAGAWTLAAIPLAVLALLDNARRVEAEAAHPDLWRPKIRAARARILLDAALIATATTLPVTTVVYLVTGVRT